MLILGVDTSGKNGSIALVRFDFCGPQGLKPFEMRETSGTAGSRALPFADELRSVPEEDAATLAVVPLEGGTFSAQLVPQISALLAQHKLAKNDLDAFAVASGPGSFTGLRVGLAAIKALAEVLQKPIAAVSLLEVVARAANTFGRVIAVLDAGRGEIFAGTYDFERHAAFEELLTISALQSKADGAVVITHDQRLADSLKAASLDVAVTSLPRADTVARLGFDKIRRGETVTPEALDASYIRRSDAEIMRSRKTPQ